MRRTLGASPHPLELRPLLPLLTAHSLLRDARGNSYRVLHNALYLPILKVNLFHAFGYHPFFKKEKTCAAISSTPEKALD